MYQTLLRSYSGRRVPGRLDFQNIYDIRLLDPKDVLDLAEKLDLIQIYFDVHQVCLGTADLTLQHQIMI